MYIFFARCKTRIVDQLIGCLANKWFVFLKEICNFANKKYVTEAKQSMNADLNTIFSKRLKSAREMRSMSMAALSAALGNAVSPQAIYKYEAGKMLPGSPQLIALSRVLDVPIDFFFRPFTVSVSGIEFRKKYKLGAKERKSIEGEAIDKVEKYFEIEEICGKRETCPLHLGVYMRDEEDVLTLVRNLRKDWGLEDKPLGNVIQLLESKGIIVIEIQASRDFDGLSGLANGIPIIVLNKEFPSPERKRFTALHELGHLVMRFDENMEDRQVETLCHLFASEMLLPRNLFEQEVGDIYHRQVSLQEFAVVQQKYGISIDALMYKAKEAHMIPENRQRNYHILKNTRPAFKEFAEKSRTIEETSARFESLVYQALSCDLISLSKASGLLGLPVDQILSHSTFI